MMDVQLYTCTGFGAGAEHCVHLGTELEQGLVGHAPSLVSWPGRGAGLLHTVLVVEAGTSAARWLVTNITGTQLTRATPATTLLPYTPAAGGGAAVQLLAVLAHPRPLARARLPLRTSCLERLHLAQLLEAPDVEIVAANFWSVQPNSRTKYPKQTIPLCQQI